MIISKSKDKYRPFLIGYRTGNPDKISNFLHKAFSMISYLIIQIIIHLEIIT
jgi:hypothetical protein